MEKVLCAGDCGRPAMRTCHCGSMVCPDCVHEPFGGNEHLDWELSNLMIQEKHRKLLREYAADHYVT